MKKKYRPWDTDRTYLLPPSTRDWLPEGHLAGFILDVVGELDLSAIEDPIQAKDPRGERPYDPRMMVALLLYGYANGVFSSRRLEHATWTDLGARFIAAETHPHFTTINSFRLVHHEALGALFLQVLKLCEKAGLVSLGHVAIDGTKIQANASKHKAMSHDRMRATEARLQGEVDALLAEADAVNKAEDEEFGDSDGSSIPEELRRRETRKERIRQARLALEEEAKAARRLALEDQGKHARERAEEADDPKEITMSDTGREQYAKRKWVVEPVFGQLKEARGFRRFHLRGLHKTRSEFSLLCTGHNLLKLWRHGPAE